MLGAPGACPHPPTLSSLANTQESGRPSTPKVSAFPPPPPASAHRQGFGRWPGRQARAGMQGSAVWRCRRHKAEGLFPRTVSAGPGRSASRSGVVLFPSPVDVLEEGHGEGHAQNLKDMGPRGLRWGTRGHPAPAGEPLPLCRHRGAGTRGRSRAEAGRTWGARPLGLSRLDVTQLRGPETCCFRSW